MMDANLAHMKSNQLVFVQFTGIEKGKFPSEFGVKSGDVLLCKTLDDSRGPDCRIAVYYKGVGEDFFIYTNSEEGWATYEGRPSGGGFINKRSHEAARVIMEKRGVTDFKEYPPEKPMVFSQENRGTYGSFSF